MDIKVLKFGGTSMADARAISQVCKIIRSDSSRRFIVVSAPGKRFPADKKITDMLYMCFHDIEITGECKETFSKVKERYLDIKNDLKLDFDFESILKETESNMVKYRSAEYCASRGEYLSAVLLSHALGYNFVDATELILFKESGEFLPDETHNLIKNKLRGMDNAVIPGFYGRDEFDIIHTFSRGGSDITGAIIARGVNASIYENWTDVNGFMVADPRIVKNPKQISSLTYRELRELAYMGANVLHPESIFPVKSKRIPINIRNTFEPENEGTMIVSDLSQCDMNEVITGVAGMTGYSIVYIEKSMMNNELGFTRKVLSAFEYYGVSFEHMPSGIDTICVVVPESELEATEDQLLELIENTVHPDKVEIINDIAIIATVGHGMSHKVGTAAIIFNALAKADVNIRMIDQGSSELNIIIGVDAKDYEKAVQSIYTAFVGK